MPNATIFGGGAYPGVAAVQNAGEAITVGNEFLLTPDTSGAFVEGCRLFIPPGGSADLPATVDVQLNLSGDFDDAPAETVTIAIADGWCEGAFSGSVPMSNVQSPIALCYTIPSFRFISTGGVPSGWEDPIISGDNDRFRMPASTGGPPRSLYMLHSNMATVNGGGNLYGLDLIISMVNVAPTVNITSTMNPIRATDTPTLSANADDDGGISSYLWSVVTGPNTSSSQFGTPTAATTTFDPTVIGDYVIECLVEDTDGESVFDTIIINVIVPSQLEIVMHSEIATRDVGKVMTPSFVNGFGPRIYAWSQVTAPAGGDSSITANGDTGHPTIEFDHTGVYTYLLEVEDTLYSVAEEVDILVLASAPDPTSHFRWDGTFWVPQQVTRL